MLARQADALINGLGDKGRKAALNLLLTLTQINEGGRHTRRRLSREDAVHVAGGGQQGEAIVMALAGKHDDQKRQTETGQTLPLIATGQDGDVSYVELVHEMLVRAKQRVGQASKSTGYWPTLYQYIYENRDRDSLRQQLQVYAQRWESYKPLRRYFALAGWRNLRLFKTLQPRKNSLEGRYLMWSKGFAWIHVIILILTLILAESALWTVREELPLSYTVIRPLWALGLYQPQPKMVLIPQGEFLMGCQDGRDDVGSVKKCGEKTGDYETNSENEIPAHEVNFIQPFKIGKYELTFMEYDYFIWDEGSKEGIRYPLDQMWGRYKRPVVQINWKEATRYTKWLSKKTGKNYRLPTEAEWEYAARANTEFAFPWGTGSIQGRANCKGCDVQWSDKSTSPVGSFQENPFKLHDMHGNVWEWVQDCWHEDYKGAPIDGSAWEFNGCQLRTIRGGSWRYVAHYMRSAYRNKYKSDRDSFNGGFRVACTLPNC